MSDEKKTAAQIQAEILDREAKTHSKYDPIEEAKGWLTGSRTHWNEMNSWYSPPGEDPGLGIVRCAEADAAEAERAYWYLRAEKEGLV